MTKIKISKREKILILLIYNTAIVAAIIYVLLTTSGCSKAQENTVTYSRWMDRNIYFADQNANDPDRNSFFQRKAVQDAMDEVAGGTNLGINYFSYTQVPESELEAIIQTTDGINFKSFILIWPDSVFNAWVSEKYDGNIPDLNAITVVNHLNKRQFYIIVRASCTTAGSNNCNKVGSNGLKALIARQLGSLVGLEFDCNNPGAVVCTDPNDSQWLDSNKNSFFHSMNNRLEDILNTPNFYPASP